MDAILTSRHAACAEAASLVPTTRCPTPRFPQLPNKCNLEGRQYNVFGYKGKQVRDNIHSLDVARFIEGFIQAPRIGEVYNIGGGKENSCSILEAFEITESITGKTQIQKYTQENRMGDHMCYYSDLRKMQSHYPEWNITIGLEQLFKEIVEGWHKKEVIFQMRFASMNIPLRYIKWARFIITFEINDRNA